MSDLSIGFWRKTDGSLRSTIASELNNEIFATAWRRITEIAHRHEVVAIAQTVALLRDVVPRVVHSRANVAAVSC